MSQVFGKCSLPVVALGIVLCAGCSTQQTAPVPKPERSRYAGVSRGIPASLQQPTALVSLPPSTVAPPAPVRPSDAIPAPEPTLANRTASLLRHRYIVSELSAFQLLVRNPANVAAPSLFEEAIALSKIRGKLKSQKVIPPGGSEKTTIKDGTVTIPFGYSVSPTDAASAISGALGVNGIQRVNASWAAPR